MRLFIAIKIPEEIVETFLQSQREIKKFNLVEGSFVKKNNFHLTLKFLGEVDDEKFLQIILSLKKIVHENFFLRTEKINFFRPKNFNKNIIFVETLGEKIFSLVNLIDHELKIFFGEREKNFVPHITLIRAKKIHNKKLFMDNIDHLKIPQKKFLVEKFYLMASKLSHTGAEYEVVEEFSLQNP